MGITEVLNGSYEVIKELVFAIYSYDICKLCGGKYLNVSCESCGTLNKELDDLVTKLNNELINLEVQLNTFKVTKLPDNHLFNLLMMLKDRDIILVDTLIEQYNYKENYYNLYKSSISNQVEGKDYTDLELSAIESMIYSNDKNVDLINYYNVFIRNALLKKQNVSYDCFKMIIKNFLELQMKNIYPNAECIIDDSLKEECGGNALFTKTRLNEMDVRDLYEGKSFFLLFTMTHELQHTYQYKEIFNDIDYVTPFIIDEIKEFVIFDYNIDYYYQNHDLVTFEAEAEIKGIEDALNYFNIIGIELLNKEYYVNKKIELEAKLHNRTRMLNCEVTTIDNEFEKLIIDHPEALLKYRKLGLLYKVKDNKVVAKTNEELARDLEFILSDSSLDVDTINMYKTFYDYYMNGSRKF